MRVKDKKEQQNKLKAQQQIKKDTNKKEYERKKVTTNQQIKKETVKVNNKGKDVDFDNYKYHEINVKTAHNKKSQVVVKKEGKIIASHDE